MQGVKKYISLKIDITHITKITNKYTTQLTVAVKAVKYGFDIADVGCLLKGLAKATVKQPSFPTIMHILLTYQHVISISSLLHKTCAILFNKYKAENMPSNAEHTQMSLKLLLHSWS